MIGGYVKGSLIRTKLNELNSLTKYDKIKVSSNIAQIQCLVDLEIISPEQANVTIEMYRRLEEAAEYKKSQRRSHK